MNADKWNSANNKHISTYSLNELMQNRFKDHVLHLSVYGKCREKKNNENYNI